jgi:hypothetical protein
MRLLLTNIKDVMFKSQLATNDYCLLLGIQGELHKTGGALPRPDAGLKRRTGKRSEKTRGQTCCFSKEDDQNARKSTEEKGTSTCPPFPSRDHLFSAFCLPPPPLHKWSPVLLCNGWGGWGLFATSPPPFPLDLCCSKVRFLLVQGFSYGLSIDQLRLSSFPGPINWSWRSHSTFLD